MNFKRIICLISALALLLSFGSAWATETEEMAEVIEAAAEDFEMTLAADIAVGMGALSDYVPTKEMTVGELANAVNVLAPSPFVAQKYFSSQAYSAPAKRITAIAVMMDILGYSVFFEDGSIDEGDDAEIQSIAGKYDISNGVVGDVQGTITMEETAELILNTMEAKTLTTIFGNDGKVEAFVSQDIYMERVLGMYLLDGIVQSTSYSSIKQVDGTKANKIVISGEAYNCEMGEYEDYIGMRVTALIGSKEQNVIALHNTSEKYMEIAAKDLNPGGIQKRVISYWDKNDKKRTISLSPVVDVLYNYSLFKDYTAEDLKIKQGRLVLIDNNDDGAIDVVKIEEYRSMMIFSASMASETITDSYGNHISISDLIKFGYPVFENGNVILPNNIPLNSIATCFINKNNQAVRIYIDSKTAAGTINKFDEEENIVTLEGKDMVYAEEIKEKLEKVELGTLVMVYLNHFGEIAHFEITGENYLYGYMITFYEGDAVSNPQIKMFTQMDTVTVYDTKDKIKLNGTSVDAKEAFAYNLTTGLWDEAGKLSQLVKYKANANGEITTLNTTTNIDPGDGSRLVKFKDDTLRYFKTPNMIGDDVRVNVYTKVFRIPTDLSFENKFDYGAPDILVGTELFSTQVYDVDEDYYAGAVVVRIDPYGADASQVDEISGATYIVLKTGTFIADNGDESVIIEARALGSTANAPIEFKFSHKDVAHDSIKVSQLKPGDIFQAQSDYTNKKEYSQLRVRYQHGLTEPYESAKGDWNQVYVDAKHFYGSGNTFAAGTIKKIIKNGFVINHKPTYTENRDDYDRLATTNGLTAVSIVENGGADIYPAALSDLQKDDNVFVLYEAAVPSEIVIYR